MNVHSLVIAFWFVMMPLSMVAIVVCLGTAKYEYIPYAVLILVISAVTFATLLDMAQNCE